MVAVVDVDVGRVDINVSGGPTLQASDTRIMFRPSTKPCGCVSLV